MSRRSLHTSASPSRRRAPWLYDRVRQSADQGDPDSDLEAARLDQGEGAHTSEVEKEEPVQHALVSPPSTPLSPLLRISVASASEGLHAPTASLRSPGHSQPASPQALEQPRRSIRRSGLSPNLPALRVSIPGLHTSLGEPAVPGSPLVLRPLAVELGSPSSLPPVRRTSVLPSEWSVLQVTDWLSARGYDINLRRRFARAAIDGRTLLMLNHTLLRDDLFMTSLGPRLALLDDIASLRRTVEAPQPAVGRSRISALQSRAEAAVARAEAAARAAEVVAMAASRAQQPASVEPAAQAQHRSRPFTTPSLRLRQPAAPKVLPPRRAPPPLQALRAVDVAAIEERRAEERAALEALGQARRRAVERADVAAAEAKALRADAWLLGELRAWLGRDAPVSGDASTIAAVVHEHAARLPQLPAFDQRQDCEGVKAALSAALRHHGFQARLEAGAAKRSDHALLRRAATAQAARPRSAAKPALLAPLPPTPKPSRLTNEMLASFLARQYASLPKPVPRSAKSTPLTKPKLPLLPRPSLSPSDLLDEFGGDAQAAAFASEMRTAVARLNTARM